MRGVKGATILILLAVAAIAFIIVATSQFRHYSDPASPRAGAKYAETLKSTPLEEIHPAPFQDVRTEINSTELKMEYPVRDETPIGMNFQLHRSSNNAIKLDDGQLELAWIAVGYTNQSSTRDYVTARIFGGDLRPAKREDFQPPSAAPRKTLHFQGQFPTAEFSFSASNLPPIKPISFQVFDARTKNELTSGYSTSSDDKNIRVGSTIKLWHQTPLDLVVTLALGPPQELTYPIEDFKEAKFPRGMVKLLGKHGDSANSWSSGSHNGTNVLTVRWDKAKPDKPEATFVFFFWPSPSSLPIDFKFLGQNGEILSSSGGRSSDNLRMASFYGNLEQAKEIKLTYYPNIHRLIFTIPELPGLPDANRGIENLFEVQIPYMRLNFEYDYSQVLRYMLAADLSSFTLAIPAGYFPKEYTNATPAMLLHDLSRFAPKRAGPIVFNPKTNRLEHRPSLFHRLRKKVEKWF